MSKFTKDEQTSIVKQAMELEAAILSGQKELSRLKSKRFKSAPAAPVRKTVNRGQPIAPDYSALPQFNYSFTNYLEDEIKTNPTFINKLFSAHPFKRCAIICGVFFVASIILTIIPSLFFVRIIFDCLAVWAIPAAGIYWLVKQSAYKSKKKELTAQFEQTSEYLNAKAKADMRAQQQQAEIEHKLQAQQAAFDDEYQKAKEHYDTVILPQYNDERSAWESEHERKVQAVSSKLDSDRKAQSELYESTRIIPMQYRSIETLTYIYQLMSTSDYDIKEAVDMYDKEIQRKQEAQRIEELQRANALADEQNYHLSKQNALLDEQNDLQAQQNEISERMRKDERRREWETLYHRHQVKKQWKKK